MAKFEVMHLDNEKVVRKTRSTGRPEVMSRPFQLLSEHGSGRGLQQTVLVSAGAYGHENIEIGQVLEINGSLADKARRNPMFQEVVA